MKIPQIKMLKDLHKGIHQSFRMFWIAIQYLWFAFVITHLIFTGKSYWWNFFGNIPTFFFGLIPLGFITCELMLKKKSRFRLVMALIALVLGSTQMDINLDRGQDCQVKSNREAVIRVFNWNTKYWDMNKAKDKFYHFLKRQNADVYLLQEYLYYLPNLKYTRIDPEKQFKICNFVPGFKPDFYPVDDMARLQTEFPGIILGSITSL